MLWREKLWVSGDAKTVVKSKQEVHTLWSKNFFTFFIDINLVSLYNGSSYLFCMPITVLQVLWLSGVPSAGWGSRLRVNYINIILWFWAYGSHCNFGSRCSKWVLLSGYFVMTFWDWWSGFYCPLVLLWLAFGFCIVQKQL